MQQIQNISWRDIDFVLGHGKKLINIQPNYHHIIDLETIHKVTNSAATEYEQISGFRKYQISLRCQHNSNGDTGLENQDQLICKDEIGFRKDEY